MQITSLVTGGAGFIGSHVVNHLIEMQHNVVVVDDLSGGFIENVNPNAIFCKGAITDAVFINKLFETYQFDYVYHLAAYAAEGLSHFIRNYNYQNNLIGSVNLINAAVNYKVKCFVFTSSIAVYGSNSKPYTEDQYPQPEDPYGIAKYAVEMDLKNAHEMFGLNYVIFRPHNVYGPHQNIGDKYRNVIGIFMNQLLEGEALTIFGDGSQTRAFTYVSDVAPHMANAPFNELAINQIFNIGADKNYTINQLAKATAKVMEIPFSINYTTARNEVVHAHADHSKFKTAFAAENTVDLMDGLKLMATWVKKYGAKKSKSFEGIEIEQKLPSVWKKSH